MTHDTPPSDTPLDQYFAVEVPPPDVDRAWQTLWAKANPSVVPTVPTAGRRSLLGRIRSAHPARRSNVTTTLTIGLFALLTAVGIVGVHHAGSGHKTQIMRTAVGERATLVLDHGAIRVTLAPQTTVSVTKNVVTLQGEAFFEVAHRNSIPLTVRTGAVTTRVLGTTFSVRRYPAETMTRVIVAEGKVSSGGNRPVTLVAGQIARLTDSTATVTTTSDVTPYTTWTNGPLVFHDASAAEMLETVGYWYGFHFKLADSTLAHEIVDAKFDGQSKAGVLAALRSLLSVTMSFDGNTVTLTPQQHRPTVQRQATRDSVLHISHEAGR